LANKAGKTFYIHVGGQGSYIRAQFGGVTMVVVSRSYSAGGGGATDIRIGTNIIHAVCSLPVGGGYYGASINVGGGRWGNCKWMEVIQVIMVIVDNGELMVEVQAVAIRIVRYSGSFGQVVVIRLLFFKLRIWWSWWRRLVRRWWELVLILVVIIRWWRRWWLFILLQCPTMRVIIPVRLLLNADDYLTNIEIIAGNQSMPNPSGGTMTGRTGNGYARITYEYRPIIDSIVSYIEPIYGAVKFLALKSNTLSDTVIAVSPQLLFSAGNQLGDHTLHFQAGTNNSGTILVGTIESIEGEDRFVPIKAVTPSISDSTEDVSLLLKTYSGNGNRLAFATVNSHSFIDNLWMELSDQTPCAFPPMELQAKNVTAQSAVISWARGYNETDYNIEYGVGDFVQGQGNSTIVNNVTDTFFVLNGLTAGTTYTFYVQSNCGDALRTEYSKISFSTECQYTIPFVEDFDSFTADKITKCWVKVGDERTPIVRNIDGEHSS
jgi:hypothetical protein